MGLIPRGSATKIRKKDFSDSIPRGSAAGKI